MNRPYVPLKIVDFVNRKTGTISKRVTGTLPNGERIQKNFSGANADVEAQALVNKHTSNLGKDRPAPVITHLSEATVRRVEVALGRLPPGADIVQAVDFFNEHHRPIVPLPMLSTKGAPATDRLPAIPPVTGAIDRFCNWCRVQRKNEEVTVGQRTIVLSQYAAFTAESPEGLPLGPITHTTGMSVPHARAWIYEADKQARTQRDRFDLLLLFSRWLVKHQHVAINVVADLDRPAVKIDAPGVLTFDEVWQLLQCALTDPEGPQMLPFFAMCVLSGIRPQEIPRLGTKLEEGGRTDGWENIHLGDENRVIEVNEAKGGLSRRRVEICDPLWRILTWCKATKLAANYFSTRKFNRIRRAAGLFGKWEKDICRHTYASAHFVVFKDIKVLIATMGNSERVLFQNYIRAMARTEGERILGLVLHWSAPRATSVASARMDKWLKKRAADLPIHILRTLIARLFGELERLERNHGSQSARADLEKRLRPLRVELALRKENAALAKESGVHLAG